MKKSLEILKLIMKINISKEKVVKKAIINFVYFAAVFSILFSFSLIFKVFQYNLTSKYSETKYDFSINNNYIIDMLDERKIRKIKEMDFIDKILPVKSFGGATIETKKGIITISNVDAVDSFEDIGIYYFSEKMIIEKNQRILDDTSKNPIIIDICIHKKTNMKIGDEVFIPFGQQGKKVKFIVAGISENIADWSPNALILWGNEQKKVFEESFGKEDSYCYMIVKCKDKQKTREYFLKKFKENFINFWGAFIKESNESNYEKEYKRIMADFNKEKDLFLKNDLISKEEALNMEYENSKYASPPIIIATSVFGFIIFIILLLREIDKKIITSEKDFAILSVHGMPNIYIVIYHMIAIAILQIPVLITAMCITKYIFFDLMIDNLYLPVHIMIDYAVGAIILQFTAVIISVVIIYKKMKRKNIVFMLTKE